MQGNLSAAHNNYFVVIGPAGSRAMVGVGMRKRVVSYTYILPDFCPRRNNYYMHDPKLQLIL